jgi:probable selenium-dependent hydroxylase accessory protein YqeC
MNSEIRGLSELRSLLEVSPSSSLVSIVGAGGKTSTMFALARSFSASGSRVLVTTTTRILDPDVASEREGRGFGRLLLMPESDSPSAIECLRSAGPRVVLAKGREDEEGKLCGVDPASLESLASLFDVVLVEADGARGLSVKAPSSTEPVIPRLCTAVVGLVGLDAIGAPMDGRTVHRPELFGPLVGCSPGRPISTEHIIRLVSSPGGLFKGAPREAARIVLLNKADTVPPSLAAECASGIVSTKAADSVVVGAFGVTLDGRP